MSLCRRCVTALGLVVSLTTLTVLAQQQQPVDGLVWDTEVYTGKSWPRAVPNPSPAGQGKSFIAAQAKLDRTKYHGRDDTTPLVSFQRVNDAFTDVMYFVDRLDAQGQPVAGSTKMFKGKVMENDWTKCNIVNGAKVLVVQDGQNVEQDFAGFDPGTYQVTVKATLTFTTAGRQGNPPVPGTTTSRSATLIGQVTVFQQ